MPGRPMRPVARWQLMIALTLSMPLVDWLMPCEYSVTTRSVLANQSKKRSTAPPVSPQTVAVVRDGLAGDLLPGLPPRRW